MSLPLTLAVLDGMVVTVANQTLVVPLTAIVETLQPEAAAIHSFGANQKPDLDPQLLLPAGGCRPDPQLPRHPGQPGRRRRSAGRIRRWWPACLMVDAIQGQRQVVIKSLEANYTHVPGIAAATILGDGRVALILDVDSVVSASRGQTLQLEASLAA